MHRVLHTAIRLDHAPDLDRPPPAGLDLPDDLPPSRPEIEMQSRADCSRWVMVDLLPPVCLAAPHQARVRAS